MVFVGYQSSKIEVLFLKCEYEQYGDSNNKKNKYSL